MAERAIDGFLEARGERIARLLTGSRRLLMLLLGPSGEVLDANRAAQRILGRATVQNGVSLAALSPEPSCAVPDVPTDESRPFSVALRGLGGEEYRVEGQLFGGQGATLFVGIRATLTYASTIEQMSRLNTQLLETTRALKARTRELEDANETIARLAVTDSLTGLGLRRALDARLPELLESSRAAGRTAAAVMVDVDKFKLINDRFGHPAGDALLEAVGRAIERACRSTDLKIRLGGDEFLVIAPGLDEAGARTMAERIQEELRSLYLASADEIPTLSIGVVLARPEDTPDTLLARADAALYGAKGGGRNQVNAQFD